MKPNDRHDKKNTVAFNEIPERELRVPFPEKVKKILYVAVAFNEIPERELRVLRAVHTRDARWQCFVAFNEIPERELRVMLTDGEWFGDYKSCCIQRNPRKGIESLEW